MVKIEYVIRQSHEKLSNGFIRNGMMGFCCVGDAAMQNGRGNEEQRIDEAERRLKPKMVFKTPRRAII